MERNIYPDAIRRNYDPDFKEKTKPGVHERRLSRHSEKVKVHSLKQPNSHTFDVDRCCTTSADCSAVNKGLVPPAPVFDSVYESARVPESIRGPIQSGELVGEVCF